MMSHGLRLSEVMGRISYEVETETLGPDHERPKKYEKTPSGKYRAFGSVKAGPAMNQMTAEDYRRQMARQGLNFTQR